MARKGLGKLIADARERRGLTQQTLAAKFGASFQVINVSRWERDVHRPSYEHARVLERELGIPLTKLMGERHPSTVQPTAAAGESAS